jgi:hypothetical protein
MEDSGNLEIFKKPNGQRGVRALKAFEKDERVLFEKPTFWLGARDDQLGQGLAWGLAGHIALNFPNALKDMLEAGYQPLYKPELSKRDKKVLKFIASKTKLAEGRVRAIYYMVVTYNLNTQFMGYLNGQVLYGKRAVICDTFSFINHSCLPNTYRPECKPYEQFVQQIEEELVATRKIDFGEEITWSYAGDLPNELKSRQQLLHQKFGFWCSCKRCKAERSA